MNAATTSKHEYQMAYRAMRNWWKLVEMNNTPGISSEERHIYQSICASYRYQELSAAMESISARRDAEYLEANPEYAAAKRRWVRADKNAQPQEIPF